MALIQPVEDGKIPKDTSTTSKSDTSNDLGYDQFLQLLCAEMQYQDPLEPTSNTEYVAQLGKYVIIKTTSSTGETTATQGFVDYVQKENGEQKICVNGVLYSLSDVYQVADTEYMEAETLAKTFAAAVAKLPSAAQLTLSDKDDVKNLKTYYDNLNSYQQSKIDTDTLKKYQELLAQMEKLAGKDWYKSTSSSTGTTTDTTTGTDTKTDTTTGTDTTTDTKTDTDKT